MDHAPGRAPERFHQAARGLGHEPDDASGAVFGCRLLLPGTRRRCPFFVFESRRLGDPRAQPRRWRKSLRNQLAGDRAGIPLKPLPELTVHYDRQDASQPPWGVRQLGVLERTCDGEAAQAALFKTIDQAGARSVVTEFIHSKRKPVKAEET